MNTVHARLKVTPGEYQDLIMDLWFQWCCTKTKNLLSLQKVLTCQPLFRWWCRELQKFEAQFMEETQFYENVISKELALSCYNENIQPIYNRFSKPLIKKAYERQSIEE